MNKFVKLGFTNPMEGQVDIFAKDTTAKFSTVENIENLPEGTELSDNGYTMETRYNPDSQAIEHTVYVDMTKYQQGNFPMLDAYVKAQNISGVKTETPKPTEPKPTQEQKPAEPKQPRQGGGFKPIEFKGGDGDND